ncbi:MAG: TadE family type IV pilus minor pilin [Microbacteriaceae bacterium]
MRSPTEGENERGSVTAEFAAAMPAVILLLASALVCVQLAGHQVLLQDAAADAARSLGRGDSRQVVASSAARALPGARVTAVTTGDLVCATVSATPRGSIATLLGASLRARSCALAGGL